MKINFDFTFKKYSIVKTYKNLNTKFLIITNNETNKNSSIKKRLNDKQNILNSIYYKYKITNKAFIRIIKISIFKNFKKIINGPIFFIRLHHNKNLFKKIIFLNKKNLVLNKTLALKLNNKIYSSKKFFVSNFLTYKDNIILLFQLNIIGMKIILKN